MTFMPRMTAEIRAIRTLRPLSWRRWPGVTADVWHVHGQQGGGGFYRSPDPRLVVFLDDGASALQLRTTEAAPWRLGVGAFYIPPTTPLWSELAQPGRFAHLDLHLDADPLAQRLRQSSPGATTDQPALSRRSLGTTPQRWLTALRIEAARDLMTDPSISLAEVAAAAGFADQAHLTRALRSQEAQRAWLAMLIAQGANCLLLDEPISALDIVHQVEVLSLVRHLSHSRDRSIIVVLHDLNMAARFCDNVVALRAGRVAFQGTPAGLMTARRLRAIYGADMEVLCRADGTPVALPN